MPAEWAEPYSSARQRSGRKAGAGWEGAPTAAPPLTPNPGVTVRIC